MGRKYDPRKHTNSYLGVKEKPVLKPIPENEDKTENAALLNKASMFYSELELKRRNASANYNRFIGKGLKQQVKLSDGTWTTMENAISMQGRIPINNNTIYSVMMTVLGNWAQNRPIPTVVAFEKDKQQEAEMLTMALEENRQNNDAAILDLEQFSNLLIKELICGKTGFGMDYERGQAMGKMSNVPMQNVFFNTDITDPRTNKGINFCGDFEDSTLDRIIAAYAKDDLDEIRIRAEYAHWIHDTQENTMDDDLHDESFYNSVPNNKVRVYNIWYEKNDKVIDVWDRLEGTRHKYIPCSEKAIEGIKAENSERLQQATRVLIADGVPVEEYEERLKDVPTIRYKKANAIRYKYKVLTPSGATLRSGVTPYAHGSHPYSFSMIPIGIVTAIAPLADYFDRLYSLFDYIINNSAKGLTVISQEALEGAGMSKAEILKEARMANGVVILPTKSISGKVVEQLSSNNTNIGIAEMMSLTLERIQQIGGVSGALSGQTPSSGTPASQYAQESQNSATNLVYFYDKFRSYMETRDMKLLKNIVQYTQEDREVNVTGEGGMTTTTYKAEIAKKIDFSVRILESNSTPFFRQMQEGLLDKFFEAGVIDEELYLSNTSAPFSDKLLEQIKARKEKAQDQGEQNPQINQEEAGQLQQEATDAANPESLKLLDQFLQ